MYLWRLHSIAHDGPELYRSTITASTRRTAIPIIQQSLLVVASVVACRSPDINVGLHLGSDAIWRGRLVGLCVSDIHASAFSTVFSALSVRTLRVMEVHRLFYRRPSARAMGCQRQGHTDRKQFSLPLGYCTTVMGLMYRRVLPFSHTTKPISSGRQMSTLAPRELTRGSDFRPPNRSNCCDNNEL